MGFAEDEVERWARLYRQHGMTPAWERVWRDGVDVTAEPPSTWVPPWSWYVAGKHGPDEREFWLRRHEGAANERGLLAD